MRFLANCCSSSLWMVAMRIPLSPHVTWASENDWLLLTTEKHRPSNRPWQGSAAEAETIERSDVMSHARDVIICCNLIFWVTPLFSMRTELIVSLQSCRSVDADAWCKRALLIQTETKSYTSSLGTKSPHPIPKVPVVMEVTTPPPIQCRSLLETEIKPKIL